MHSHSGRFATVFNGEIYNFAQLRARLEAEGRKLNGHSDTEVALACFEHWGIESSLRRFNGMVAFAIWDDERKELTLARESVGKKPLFIFRSQAIVLFGSRTQGTLSRSCL